MLSFSLDKLVTCENNHILHHSTTRHGPTHHILATKNALQNGGFRVLGFLCQRASRLTLLASAHASPMFSNVKHSSHTSALTVCRHVSTQANHGILRPLFSTILRSESRPGVSECLGFARRHLNASDGASAICLCAVICYQLFECYSISRPFATQRASACLGMIGFSSITPSLHWTHAATSLLPRPPRLRCRISLLSNSGPYKSHFLSE